MSNKCITHEVNLLRLKQEIESPALSSLIEKGWSAIGTVVLDDGQKPVLHIIMSPPKQIPSNLPLLIMLAAIAVELGFLIYFTV